MSNNNLKLQSEKIAQAIYIISHHLKDNEPLKWELRKTGLEVFNCTRSMGNSDDLEDLSYELTLDTFKSLTTDIISLLSLSAISGLISKNNVNFISGEINSILNNYDNQSNEDIFKKGMILSEDFFRQMDDKSQINNHNLQNKTFSLFDSKSLTNKVIDRTNHKEGEVKKGQNIRDKKDSRQSRIISLLKNQKNLTIKDFTKIISDCSEKTIQRELINLVERGIVKKEGERRWSTYSLK